MLFPQKINVIANTRHLNPQGEVVVTQNDTGVEFLVSVVGDGGQTKLPQDTAYVLTSLHLRKQPSQKIGTLQPDGNISFKLGAHELDQTGSVQAYVQAYHPLNGRVTSNPFIYHVASDPLSGAAIMPADKSLIETVIGDGPGIIQLAKEETQANITERARLTGAVGGALGSLEQDKTEALSTLEAAKAAAVEVTEVAAEKAGLAEEKAVFADAQGTFAKIEGEKAIAAAKLAADEAAAARLQKEEIAQTIAKGPVVSINGKTGPVTGIAEQAEVDEVNRKLAEKASKQDLANMGSASPKGTYATLSALQTAFPSGTTGIYLVTADGKWYYWNSSAWTAGGVYQSNGIADGSITQVKTTLRSTFDSIDNVTEYLTGKRNQSRAFVQADLNTIRGTFTLDGVGDLTLSENTVNFAHTFFPENFSEFKFTINFGSTPLYLILGVLNDELHMVGVNSTISAKGYKVTANGTVLGSQIINKTVTAPVAGDVITVIRVSDRVTIKKNDVIWFEITNAEYPNVHKNRFGILLSANTNLKIAKTLTLVATEVNKVSGMEKIEASYLKGGSSNPFETVKWGTIGDSLTANTGVMNTVDYGTNYRFQVQALLGIGSIDNKAVSGSAIARSTLTTDAHAMHLKYTELANDCRIVTVFGGTNDYRGANQAGVPIGVKGSVDNYEFYGALKTLIEGLLTKFPKAKIAFITPPRRTNDTSTNLVGHTLKDYVDAIKDICADYSIPVLDLYRGGGINRLNAATLQTDGLHMNQLGYEMISRKIAKFVDEL